MMICFYSDELPEKLSLPEVLTLSSSVQNLVSLSLLGKSNYPFKLFKIDLSVNFRFLELPHGKIGEGVTLRDK